jgi:uncharacterized membrane protein YgcG
MKQISRSVLIVLVLSAVLLSACGAVSARAASAPSGGKVQAAPVAFVGVVESINGDQWVINGQALTVDPTKLRDGPFAVGDSVKVEGTVNLDGSFTVSRVEAPSGTELSELPQLGDDNSNNANSNDNSSVGNSNDANGNDANSNDANINDSNSNDANVNDSNSNDANINDDNSNSANSNDNSSVGNSNDDNGGGKGGDSSGGKGGGDDSGGGGSDDGGGSGSDG